MARLKGPSVTVAYQTILERILSFALLPGDTVSDNALAQELDMSRTPVREAMQRLVYEGLVKSAGTKWVVAPLTLDDVAEICQVRETLESKAVELILRKGGLTQDQLAYLRQLNQGMREAISRQDYESNFEFDDRFHNEIMINSQNSRLIQLFNCLRLQILRARWLTVYRCAYPYEQSLRDHEALIDALERMNLGQARFCVEKHLATAEENFSQAFSASNDSMALKALHLLNADQIKKKESRETAP